MITKSQTAALIELPPYLFPQDRTYSYIVGYTAVGISLAVLLPRSTPTAAVPVAAPVASNHNWKTGVILALKCLGQVGT